MHIHPHVYIRIYIYICIYDLYKNYVLEIITIIIVYNYVCFFWKHRRVHMRVAFLMRKKNGYDKNVDTQVSKVCVI